MVSPRPRRWLRRVLIGVNIFVALCLVVTASAYGYYKWQFSHIHRTTFGCAILRNCGDDSPGQPMNVLLVGSDSRKNISAAERKQLGTEGQVGGERSDVMMILRVDPAAQKAAILSIPRDLYVPIANTKGSNKINSAFEHGPNQLIATITASLGIPIDHYAEVDFNGFRGIVNVIGGVDVYFAAPAKDVFTGLDIRKAGCVNLDGNGSLKLVRSRHYTYFESGRWREDPTGDLGRIDRQQDFIRRVLKKAAARGKNPFTLNQLISKGVQNLTIDNALSSKDMLRIAKRFNSLSPDAVDFVTLPTYATGRAGQSVLILKQPEAQAAVDHFLGVDRSQTAAGGPLPPVQPNTVRVRVLNGTGKGGQATEVGQALAANNFNIAGTGDGDSFKYIASVIKYGPGQLEKAKLLQPYVGGAVQLREDLTLKAVDLVLVTGAEFTEIRSAASAAPPTTTTTATAATPKSTAPANRGAPAQPQC